MSQPGSDAADRLGHAGGVLAVQVGHERWPQRCRNIGHPFLKGQRLDRRWGRCVEDAEVEQDLAGAVGGAAIVFGAAPGTGLPNIAGVQQLLQIAVTQTRQWAGGLDQQPGDDLRSDG